MKVNLKNKFKLIKALLKRNAFSLSCFLLAVLVCITGTLSYSRYISSAPAEGDGTIGSFTVSSEIDSVSALSFTNTAFWGGTSSGGTEVAMNALRSIEFSVRNYEEVDGVQKVAEVKTGYSLTFAAPVNFIDRLAFQVFDADEYPILPQFVTEDFLREVHTGEHDYDTGLSKDYHGIHTAGDLVFKTSILSDGSYLASSVDIHGHNVSVKFTPYTDTVHQQLMFRTWDVWKLTDKAPYYMDQESGGTLLAPLVANYVQVVDFYRVTVSSDAFVMPAGEPVVKEHCIHLTPTHPINDNHLGAHLVDENEQLSTLVYGGPDNNGVLPYWTLKTTREDYKDAYYVENVDGTINENDYVNPLTKDNEQIVIEYSENILGHPIPYEYTGEWVELDEEKTETILQNVTSHVGGTLVCIVFSAIVSSVPAIFQQKVLAVITKYWEAGNTDWSAAKQEILPLVLILVGLYVLSIICITLQTQLMAVITQGYLTSSTRTTAPLTTRSSRTAQPLLSPTTLTPCM